MVAGFGWLEKHQAVLHQLTFIVYLIPIGLVQKYNSTNNNGDTNQQIARVEDYGVLALFLGV